MVSEAMARGKDNAFKVAKQLCSELEEDKVKWEDLKSRRAEIIRAIQAEA